MEIVMLGDSLVAYFDRRQALPHVSVINRGIEGETVSGLLERIPDEVADSAMPDCVMIMAGTNNLVMDDYFFLPDYEKIVKKLKEEWPDIPVVVTSLLPIRLPWLAPDAVRRLNDLLLGLAERTRSDFLDVHDAFCRGESAGKALFLSDGVHLTAAGYAAWLGVMKGYLFPAV
ncbi:MAG: GDSL family lipase [Desulfobulbaceae bacterium]|nr:GDSL family lipase [Desulfobulbaceae bacterium]